jgi:two-component system cell cycle sensor histidine kinase/response regulator CckA
MSGNQIESGAAPAALLRALEESEARFRALVQRAGYGIYRSSPEGRFLDVNPALVAMLGYATPEELYALDIAQDVYFDPEERDRLRHRPVQPAFVDWVETRWKRRDGSSIAVRLSVRCVCDEQDRAAYYEGVAEDMTERQRHDEILRRSERMASLGTALAGVAHELNNPLAAIIGFAQLLLKKPWSDDDRAALEAINHEAIRSATIIKDLLALARKREVERRMPTNLNDVAGYILRTRRYALETTGIVCELSLDPALPVVLGDRTQLEQVVLNLLNNAEHALSSAMDAQPGDSPDAVARIRITTRREGSSAVLEVEDNGPGIPDVAVSRIWDPFWTTKEEGEGIGLGLAVVHGIVADHGGTIGVERATDGGARFTIRLPAALDSAGTQSAARAIRPLDVLVVDPVAADLGFVERFLTSRGHAVLNAPTAELALRLAQQSEFDAVVCDAELAPRGAPLATALRATPGCAKARFILATSDPGAVSRRSDIMADAAIVARPYDVEELRRLIEGE